MSSIAANNKRIAKNTIYLYLRMLVTMGVSLYTTRVVINALGVSDYGVYNVMGGIIGMLVYVNTLLSGGTSRFLTIELGKGNMPKLRLTFSIANLLSCIAALLVLVLGETIGLWFMNTQLNIDPSRMQAANWVYQCALLSCCFTVLQTPFSAAVIAHEKMSVYAYMSIFDVSMKLLVAFALLYFKFDKLILYAVLMLVSNVVNVLLYGVYCFRKFEEVNLKLMYDRSLFHEMLTFSGWNMIGAFSNLLNNYGLNILLNIFFGTVVNAARGIAIQVSGIIQQLYANFQMASRPQIMKYYAQNDVSAMSQLICNTARYSSLLLICVAVPVCFNIDGILALWLGQNPEYTSWFIRIILLQSLFFAIDAPVGMGIHAVGRMKLPNVTSALLYLSVFPLTYIAMRLGAGPISSYVIYVLISPVILLVDLWILNKYTGFDIRAFLSFTITPTITVLAVAAILPIVQCLYLPQSGVRMILVNCAISVVYVCLVVFFVGVPQNMRKRLINVIASKLPWSQS